jgi:NAD(P)-dependent dehydrogenase (short-subunit alcohol dehydrogenase family)
MHIAITGTSRGLGLEFTRLYLEAGHQVLALARNPEGQGLAALQKKHAASLVCVSCDVADEKSVKAAAAKALEICDAVHLLINNAGTYGDADQLAEIDFAEMRQVFETNAFGPLRATRAFLPLLRKASPAKVVHITSLMGSIEDNRSGGYYAYRMSKAALNMASVNLARELKSDDLISVLIHPGWVKTDMGGPHAPLEIKDAVASMIHTIDRLTPRESGGFLDRHGKPQPW